MGVLTASYLCCKTFRLSSGLLQTGKGSTERSSLTLIRQPLPQVAAASKLIHDSSNPARTAQYIRINYFSSSATQSVMKVRSYLQHV
jgi:hypothetical protein